MMERGKGQGTISLANVPGRALDLHIHEKELLRGFCSSSRGAQSPPYPQKDKHSFLQPFKLPRQGSFKLRGDSGSGTLPGRLLRQGHLRWLRP